MCDVSDVVWPGKATTEHYTQANEWILNDGRQYQRQNKVSKVIQNMANHIRLVGTFSSRLYGHNQQMKLYTTFY